MKDVLFASTKPLERAENIKTLYEAYEGGKTFVQVDPWRKHPDIKSGLFNVMVIDEYPTETPGRIIAVGHGIPGGKTSGLEQPNPYYYKEQASLITYAITSSIGMVSLVARYTGISESSVLPLGMPRTDAYKGRKKGDGKTLLGSKRAYLYAPTYRSRQETPMPVIDWEWLDNELSDNELLAVKPHTMTGEILKRHDWRHIIEIPPYEPSAPYLYDCDVLITDYSSILFDGYLLNKPGVLFEKVKGYTETRGMYLKYPMQYSSRYCTNEGELLETIRTADRLNEVEMECINLVAGECDGRSTERVCNLIRSCA